jgi:dolichyl-phosphate-mannose--protein O-mannosyl transferase
MEQDSTEQSSDLSENSPVIIPPPKSNPNDMDLADLWIVFAVTFFGFQSRIWALHQPPVPVIQEQYYGRFLNFFRRSEFFVMSEPPLSIMIIGLYAWACEYSSDITFSGVPARPFSNKVYTSLRFCSACLAGFVPVMIFLTLRWIHVSRYASFTAAIMIFCETSLIAEARLISVEGSFQFFVVLLILAMSLELRLPFLSVRFLCSLAFSGLCFGFVVSTKFSGLSLIPFVISFQHVIASKQLKQDTLPDCRIAWNSRRVILRTAQLSGAIFLIGFTMVYFFCMLFIAILPIEPPGVDELWPEFRNRLVNKFSFLNYSQRMYAEPMPLSVAKLVASTLRQPRLVRNATFAAKLWQFPIGFAPMDLLWRQDRQTFATHINWFNSVIGTFAIGYCLLAMFEKGPKLRLLKVLPFVVGFGASFGQLLMLRTWPFASDYAVPLIFGILTFCTGAHWLLMRFQFAQGIVLTIAQFLPVFGFVLWCPWAYGLPGGRVETRVWVRSWDRDTYPVQ